MTIGQIAAGGRILADTIAAIAPLCVIKPTDESVTSSIVLQDDNALVLPVVADGTYILVCFLDYEGGTGGSSDIKVQWSVPSGSAMRHQPVGAGTGGGAITGFAYAGSTVTSYGTQGAGNLCGLTMIGSVVVGSTAGNVQLLWAQNTSDSTPTIVHAQSFLAMWRIT